jgi:hypothetical protein
MLWILLKSCQVVNEYLHARCKQPANYYKVLFNKNLEFLHIIIQFYSKILLLILKFKVMAYYLCWLF